VSAGPDERPTVRAPSPPSSSTGSGSAIDAASVSPAGELHVLERAVPPESGINDSLVVGLSIAAAILGLVFGITLTLDGPLPLYGGALAGGLLCLAYAVRRYFTGRFPDVTAIEPRLQFAEADDEADPVTAEDLAGVRPVVGRRPVLKWTLVGGAATFGAGLAAPIATLGPTPGRSLAATAWEAGTRLVTTEGEYLRPEDLAVGGVTTVWPEGAINQESSATLLLRLSAEPIPPTVLEWVVGDGVLCYSKICTHAGCPVALYREQDNALFCPCHQSTFDVTRGAIPTFGPAARALPQLPLAVDEEGFLIATGDFPAPVGPAYD